MQIAPSANTILSFAGALATTSFQLTAAIPGGRGAQKLRLTTKVVAVDGTSITGAVIETLASNDGTNFFPIASVADDDPSDVAQTHTYAVSGAGTVVGSCVIDASYAFYKVGVKLTGGAGITGELLAVSARAIF